MEEQVTKKLIANALQQHLKSKEADDADEETPKDEEKLEEEMIDGEG